MSRARRELDQRAWNGAVEAERLICVSEWARAHQMVLEGKHEMAPGGFELGT